MVRAARVEDEAVTTAPCHLALHAEEPFVSQVDNEVIWLTASEGNENVHIALDERAQHRGLRDVSTSCSTHR